MNELAEFLRSQTARRFFDDFSKLAHAVSVLAQQKSTAQTTAWNKPRYKHAAPSNTVFLGQWQEYDLYYMPTKNGTDVYLARYGDLSNDMSSSEWITAASHGAPGGWVIAVKIAQFIATELELQKPRTRKQILAGTSE